MRAEQAFWYERPRWLKKMQAGKVPFDWNIRAIH